MGGLFESNLHLVSNLRNIFPLLNLFGAGGEAETAPPIGFLLVPEKWKNGDLCGPAEFCFSRMYRHKKQARSVFFSEFPFYVLEDRPEAKKRDKDLARLPPPPPPHTHTHTHTPTPTPTPLFPAKEEGNGL